MPKMRWIVLAGFTLGFIGASWGQPILVYKTSQEGRKYVFARTVECGNKIEMSEVIIADSINIRSNFPMCRVTFSNALILHTQTMVDYSPIATTNLIQSKFSTDVFSINVLSDTKVLFNDSLIELNHVQFDGKSTANVVYRGEAAIQEIRKLGITQPDDFDPNWCKD